MGTKAHDELDDGAMVRVLKALADATRFSLVQQIAIAGELSCGQLAETFPLSQPTISHHLKVLTDAGIVMVRPEGKHHYFSVDRALLEGALRSLPLQLLINKGKGAGPSKKSVAARSTDE